MNITISSLADEIIAVLEYICGKFGIVIDWTSDTVLPYAEIILEHYIQWITCKSIFWIATGGVALIASIFIIVMANKKWDTDGLATLLGVALMLAGLILICIFATALIKAQAFPELSVAEYIKSYIRNKS